MVYAPWADGEPNNDNDNEFLVALKNNPAEGWGLNDVPNTYNLRSVCEMEMGENEGEEAGEWWSIWFSISSQAWLHLHAFDTAIKWKTTFAPLNMTISWH